MVDSLVDALVVIDASGRIIYANPALGRLLDWPVEDLFGVQFKAMLPERTRGPYSVEFERWMDSDPPLRSPGPRRIDMLTADGSELPVDVATFLVAPDQGPRLVVAALWDVHLRVDFDRFQRVADDLMVFLAGASGTAEQVVSDLLGIIAGSLDFDFATAWRWDDEQDLLVCEYTWCQEGSACAALREASVGMTVRAKEGLAGLVADTNTPRWFGDLTQAPYLRRHDAIVQDGMQSAFIFPIRTKEHLVGVIELFGRTRGRPDGALFDAIAAVGARLGEFIERLELEEQRKDLLVRLEQATVRQAFLLEASLALAQADSFKETIHRLGEVAVPTLGDICLIDVVTQDGSLERLTARHADIRLQDSTDRLLAHPPDISGTHPAALAVRTGVPQWSTDMDKAFMTATTDGREHFELTQTLGFRSFVSVPLIADEETIGALTVVTTAVDGSFGGGELQLTEDLARQVAKVVERARSLDEQSMIARRLQESLLPSHVVQSDSVDLAVRYEAFGRGAQVGGDFYDVIPLSTNRLALVIGDVEGHDMAAATVMGQLRNAMRAYFLLEDDPGAILALLDSFLAEQATDRFATTALLVLDTDSGEITCASAGHPAPVVCSRAGSFAPLALVPGPPIGIGGGSFPVERAHLSPLDVVVFYTDGLLEIGRPDHAGQLERLGEVIGANADKPCDAIADRLLQSLTQRSRRVDDVALIVTNWIG